ncbi:MAG: hypothetical protein NC222_06910 [Staphylococcus sp.]|nr:hypothetical protein [Staphylococcus sp.]
MKDIKFYFTIKENNFNFTLYVLVNIYGWGMIFNKDIDKLAWTALTEKMKNDTIHTFKLYAWSQAIKQFFPNFDSINFKECSPETFFELYNALN